MAFMLQHSRMWTITSHDLIQRQWVECAAPGGQAEET